MKSKIFLATFFITSLILVSCQKDDLHTTTSFEDSHLTQSNTESINSETLPGQKKNKACNKIYLTSNYILINDYEDQIIIDALIESGISLVNSDCEVNYYQNDDIPNWSSRVDASAEIAIIEGQVYFRIKDLYYVCYGCFGNSFCSYDNTTITVTKGNNGCVLGNFTLDVGTDQYVLDLNLASILNYKLCSQLDCSGTGG